MMKLAKDFLLPNKFVWDSFHGFQTISSKINKKSWSNYCPIYLRFSLIQIHVFHGLDRVFNI